MALNKNALSNSLVASGFSSSAASAVADAMDTFVKSGTVNVTVSTTGTAAAQTGTGTGSIS